MSEKTILLVDDEEIILKSYSRNLTQNNFKVDTASSGEEAVAKLRANRYRMVLTDLMLGTGMSGIDILVEAKKINPELCVVIFTGFGDMTTAIDALRQGADDYLLKPCNIDDVILRLSRCFDKQDLLRQVKEQNRKLSAEIEERRRAEEALRESEKRLRLALDATSDGVWDRNLLTGEVFYGDNWYEILGYHPDEAERRQLSWEKLLHAEDRPAALAALHAHIAGKTPRYVAEFRMRNKVGKWQWILARGKVVGWDADGRPLRFVGTHTDITKRKLAEESLQNTYDELEQRVKERTTELAETNTALKVLLRKRDQDKLEFEERILTNVKEFVEPYLAKLKNSRLNDRQITYLNILEANLQEIVAPFLRAFSLKHIKLTPAEIQVANFVKQGMTSKEIADVMSISPGTVNVHRKNIRKKSGITNKKINLRTILSSYR